MKPTFYITTAIDYPNGSPHMGHAYEKVVSDVYARWYRLLGRDVFFLTGTDENGQKLVKAAESAKQQTLPYVDSQVLHFKKLCQSLNISNDDFIRTTEQRHIDTCQALWQKLEKKGDIYFGEYEGQYCLACESFYTDLQAPDGKCPVHGSVLELVKEKGFFFKLSAYSDWVKNYIESHPDNLCPASVRKEMLNRIAKEPIRDLSISRPSAGWGIPVPGASDYVMYTWFDALINYYTAVQPSERVKYWPADIHVIGKDIVWFHTVIWLSMLKALDLPLQKQVYVHGMVLGQDGRKMSKSLNNGVDPLWVLEKFPIDSFRYYLLRAIPSGMDGAFVTADLLARHNNELANDYGNLLMRVTKLSLKRLPAEMNSEGVKADLNFVGCGEKVSAAMELREHHRALEYIWETVNETNNYLNLKAPWKQENPVDFKQTIYNALYGIHCAATLVSPFMPGIGDKTLSFLGTNNTGLAGLKFGEHIFRLTSPDVLFPKIEATDS